MRRYESLYILKPDLPTEETEELCQKFTDIIADHKGNLIKEDKWGVRTLAYEVKKHNRGYYVLLDYAGDKSIIQELERIFKLHENVIRFITLVTDEHFTSQKMEAVIKAEEEKKSSRAPEPEAKEEAEDTDHTETETEKTETASSESIEGEEQ